MPHSPGLHVPGHCDLRGTWTRVATIPFLERSSPSRSRQLGYMQMPRTREASADTDEEDPSSIAMKSTRSAGEDLGKTIPSLLHNPASLLDKYASGYTCRQLIV